MLAIGLLIFEDLPNLIVGLCIACNFLYFISLRTFPEIDVFSPVFVVSIILFVLHNYFAFNHFSMHYMPFSEVIECFWLKLVNLALTDTYKISYY